MEGWIETWQGRGLWLGGGFAVFWYVCGGENGGVGVNGRGGGEI